MVEPEFATSPATRSAAPHTQRPFLRSLSPGPAVWRSIWPASASPASTRRRWRDHRTSRPGLATCPNRARRRRWGGLRGARLPGLRCHCDRWCCPLRPEPLSGRAWPSGWRLSAVQCCAGESPPAPPFSGDPLPFPVGPRRRRRRRGGWSWPSPRFCGGEADVVLRPR